MSITYRMFQKTDLPTIVHIANLLEAQRDDSGRTTEEGMQQTLAAPYIHPEEDFFVAVNTEGEVIAASLLVLRSGKGMFLGDVITHPDYHASGVTDGLVQRSEARALQRADEQLPEAKVIHLNFGVQEYKTYLQTVLDTFGYAEVRQQYVMRITLDAAMEKPEFPPEYSFRPFDKERDAKQVHAIFQECFADHWGGVAQIPFERWAHQFENSLFDPTLWYILYHENDIAAICLCELSSRDTSLGLVEVIGVRPAFRKQGLGGLLLRHAFYEFQQRGYQHVMLDVDTENTTNAVALYEKAGMQVNRYIRFCRKVLHGNPADIED